DTPPKNRSATTKNGRRQSAAKTAATQWRWEKPFRKVFQARFAEGPLAVAHAEWSRHLAERGLPTSQLLAGKQSPLVWGLPVSLLGPESQPLIEMLHRVERGKAIESALVDSAAADWLQGSATRDASPAGALIALAWAYALPSLAARLEAERWW